ncbi:MAG: acetoin utilization protein AcuC [Magnetococcales bacterium]|nr:acetoin utilization protein AcuC [Magnetococcales bacterium]MBF0115533.1 acetoin utilization protein AcuC [Magnetococcales bacterium]
MGVPFTTSVTIGEEIARYGFPDGHPFGPHRMGVFWQEARRLGLDGFVTVHHPVAATREELERFHTPAYVSLVQSCSDRGSGLLDHGDTPAFPGVYEAASHVVGSALQAMEEIMAGRCRRAFIPIAGLHHARRHMAGGFCVFNDAGVVIHTLRAKHGLRKVAYVDIDAHHGDGVFYGFEDDPELIFADLHQDGRTIYPGTGSPEERGRGAAEGTKLNISLPPGAGDTHFAQVWPQVVAFLQAHKPEFIILQAGTDSIAGDPLTQLRLSPATHFLVATRLVQLAESFGHGRVLALGGGGYNANNIAKGWCEVVRALVETPVRPVGVG